MIDLKPAEIEARIAAFLTSRLPAAEDIRIELSTAAAKAGFSAETMLFDARYRVDGSDIVRPMVLRRQIFGHDLTFDADLRLQWQVMEAMNLKSDLPVPPLVGIELDHALLGAPFLVMERMPGRIVPQNPNYHLEGWLADLPVERRQEVWFNGIAAMARVHRVDWTDGFAFLDDPKRGRTGLPQYLSWVKEWLGWALAGRSHPVAEAAMAYLEANVPEDAPISVLWGDAIPANLLYGEDNQVTGIIDWEFAALAPGEIDLGWWLYFDELFSGGFHVPRLEGLPGRDQTIAAYEKGLGRAVRDLPYYELIVGLRMTIVTIRAVDRVVAFGKLPAENDAWLNNPSTAWLARHLGLPDVIVGPDFHTFTKRLFGTH